MRNKPFTFKNLWVPCKENVIAIVLFVFIAYFSLGFLTTFPTSFLNSCVIKTSNLFFQLLLTQNRDLLVAIHTGIGAITFSIGFIIADSLKGEDGQVRNVGRVLIRESFFFTLLVYEITVFILFLVNPFQNTSLNSIFVLTAAIFSLFTLTETLSLLMDRNELKRNEIKLTDELVQESIKALKTTEDVCRKKEKFLIRKLEELGVEVNTNKRDYGKYFMPLALPINSSWILTEIKDELREILKTSQTEATKLKKETTQPEEQNYNIIINISAVFDQQKLDTQRNIVIDIPRNLKSQRKKLKKRTVEGLFELEYLDLEQHYNLQLKEELNSFSNKLRQSINSKENSDDTKLFSDILFNLFLVALSEENVHSIGIFIDTLHQLNCQLIEQTRNHFAVQKFKIVFSIQSSFLSSLIYENRDRKDNKPLDNIIQQILNNYLYYYWLITDKKGNIDDAVYKFVLDRIWRIPKEKYQYLEHERKKFILIVRNYFDKLLFNSLESNTSGAFSNFEHLYSKYHSLLTKETFSYEEENNIIFFIPVIGLIAWCELKGRTQEKHKQAMALLDRDILQLDHKELTRLFIETKSSSNSLRWEDRELFDRENDGSMYVTEIKINSYIDKVYTDNLIKMIPEKKEDIERFTVDILNAVDNNYEKVRNLNFLFTNIDTSNKKVSSFKTLFNVQKEKIEEKEIISNQIDPKKVDEFKKQTFINFKKNALIRRLINVDYTKLGTFGKSNYGNSVFLNKDIFFKHWEIHYLGVNDMFADALAKAENYNILKKIKESDKSELITIDKLKEKIKNIEDPIMIFDYVDYLLLNKLGERRWTTNQTTPYKSSLVFEDGVEIPIYDIPGLKERNTIYILSKKNIGTLIQMSPSLKDIKDVELTKENYIHIGISIYNKKRKDENQEIGIKRTLENPPEFMKDNNKEKWDKKRIIRYLELHVLVDVYESFDFQLDKNFKGYIVKLDKN